MLTLDAGPRRAIDICNAIERMIRDGELGAGDQLPTVRSLATDLEVSPTTVAAAYRQLRQRGIISTHGRGGTRVHHRPPLDVRVDEPLADGVTDLRFAWPDPQVLPDRRAALAALDATPADTFDGELAILTDLLIKDLERDEITTPGLAVADRATSALTQVLASSLRAGDRVAVEDPADPQVRDLLTAEGYQLQPLPMDTRGVIPEALDAALRAPIAAIVLTPRGQDPTSTAYDDARQVALAEVLERHPDPLTIERDPVGPVAGVHYRTVVHPDRARWAVLRSFGTALGGDLDLTAIAGDAATLGRVRGRQLLLGGRPSMVLQGLVHELLTTDDGQRTVNLAARTYGARRIAFLAELRNRGIAAQGLSGGYVWLPVDKEALVVEPLLERGWAVTSGDRFRMDASPGIRIAVTRLTTEAARHLADDLLEVLAS